MILQLNPVSKIPETIIMQIGWIFSLKNIFFSFFLPPSASLFSAFSSGLQPSSSPLLCRMHTVLHFYYCYCCYGVRIPRDRNSFLLLCFPLGCARAGQCAFFPSPPSEGRTDRQTRIAICLKKKLFPLIEMHTSHSELFSQVSSSVLGLARSCKHGADITLQILLLLSCINSVYLQ